MNLSYLGDSAPNVDINTGIRYGFVQANHLNPESVDDIIVNGDNVDYLNAVEDIQNGLKQWVNDWDESDLESNKELLETILGDYCYSSLRDELAEEVMVKMQDRLSTGDIADDLWEAIGDRITEGMEFDNATYRLEDGDTVLVYHSDGDICVLKSPYVARRGLCSPCAPNAGHLETDGEYLTYVLGPEWWGDHGDGVGMPYSIEPTVQDQPEVNA